MTCCQSGSRLSKNREALCISVPLDEISVRRLGEGVLADHRLVGTVSEEFINGKCFALPGNEAVFIQTDHAALNHERIELLDGEFRWLVQIKIEMQQADFQPGM